MHSPAPPLICVQELWFSLSVVPFSSNRIGRFSSISSIFSPFSVTTTLLMANVSCCERRLFSYITSAILPNVSWPDNSFTVLANAFSKSFFGSPTPAKFSTKNSNVAAIAAPITPITMYTILLSGFFSGWLEL